jgi:hypothetical protein
MDPLPLWQFLPWGYLLTVLIELPILFFGLSPRHPRQDRITAGWALTAVTYPVVVVVIPLLLGAGVQRWVYLTCAEVFAPFVECLLFWWIFVMQHRMDRYATIRDFGVIVGANLASFVLGEWAIPSAAPWLLLTVAN